MYIDYIYEEIIHNLLIRNFPTRISCYSAEDVLFLNCFRDEIFMKFELTINNEKKLESIFDFLIKDYESILENKREKFKKELEYKYFSILKTEKGYLKNYADYSKSIRGYLESTDEYSALHWLKVKKSSKHFNFNRFLLLFLYAYEWRFESSYLDKYPTDLELVLQKCFNYSDTKSNKLKLAYSGTFQKLLINLISENLKYNLRNNKKFQLERSL